jgi:hypothetical protein
MRKLTWALLFCFTTMAIAEEVEIRFTDAKKPVKCAPLMDALNGIQKMFAEEPTWNSKNQLGPQEDTNIALFQNKKTGTWTLLEFNSKTACFLATGVDNSI